MEIGDQDKVVGEYIFSGKIKKEGAELREFIVKGTHAAFPSCPFGSQRNINAPKARQMALKFESFTYESFKCKWSSLYVHVSRPYLMIEGTLISLLS
jgi:hypothetical protein